MSTYVIEHNALCGADGESLDLTVLVRLVSLGIYPRTDPEGECAYALELTPEQARRLGRALLEAADISEVDP